MIPFLGVHMGILDSIRDRASQVKQSVSDAVQKVENKAAAVVEKVETKAAEVGHEVKSTFEKTVLPKPPPSAPPATSTVKPVTSGPAGLRAALSSAISDQLKAPPPSSDTQKAAVALKEKNTSWKGLDHEGLARDMADLVKKDPVAAAPILKEIMNTQVARSNKDDVAEAFANQLSADQLKALARHPDGAAALATMEHELRTGWTTGHESEMANKLKAAASDAEKGPLPNTPVDLPAGANGVFNGTGSKTTAAGKIPQEMWSDPSKLVAQLTQNPATGTTPGNTCAASSMLASTLMASPEKAARFLENVGRSEDAKNLSVGQRNDLLAIADRVRNKTASFEDLNKAQGLLFTAGNTHGDVQTIGKVLNDRGMYQDAQGTKHLKNLTGPEDAELRGIIAQNTPWTDHQAHRLEELTNRATGLSMHMEKIDGGWAPKIEGDLATMDPAGFSDAEARKLARMGGLKDTTAVSTPDPTPGAQGLGALASKLKPGEAISVRVSGDPNGSVSDHFISVGRRDDGTLYLYNSDPAQGDASVTVGGKGNGTDAFRQLLTAYDNRQYVDPNQKMPAPVPYRID